MIGPYTREKICNLNDDCNLSLQCEFSRGGTNSYINSCAHKHKGHVSSASQKIHTQNSHCDLSETSLEVTSGLEFEFVIVISICDSNVRTHVLKIVSRVIFHWNDHSNDDFFFARV